MRFRRFFGTLLSKQQPAFETAISKPDLSRRLLIKDVPLVEVGSEVLVCGWLQVFRPTGPNKIFAELRDRSGTIQLLLDSSNSHTSFESLKRILKGCPLESVVAVRGKLTQRPMKDQKEEGISGRLEVIPDRIEILNEATDLPFNPFIEDPLVLPD